MQVARPNPQMFVSLKNHANDLNKDFDSQPSHMKEKISYEIIKMYEDTLQYASNPSEIAMIKKN